MTQRGHTTFWSALLLDPTRNRRNIYLLQLAFSIHNCYAPRPPPAARRGLFMTQPWPLMRFVAFGCV